MKSLLFKISGESASGDLAVLSYTTPRGGMSSVIYRIGGGGAEAVLVDGVATRVDIPIDSLAIIAAGLAAAVNHPQGEFCPGQFNATSAGDMLAVSCSDAVSDVTFIVQIQGSGTGKIEQHQHEEPAPIRVPILVIDP